MRPARRIEGYSQLAAAVGRSSANAGGVESEACDRKNTKDANALNRNKCASAARPAPLLAMDLYLARQVLPRISGGTPTNTWWMNFEADLEVALSKL